MQKNRVIILFFYPKDLKFKIREEEELYRTISIIKIDIKYGNSKINLSTNKNLRDIPLDIEIEQNGETIVGRDKDIVIENF